MPEIIEVANEILAWWKHAQFLITDGEFNVFDSDDDIMFDRLRKAVEEIERRT